MKTKEQMMNELREFVAKNFLTEVAATRKDAAFNLQNVGNILSEIAGELNGQSWYIVHNVSDVQYNEGMY